MLRPASCPSFIRRHAELLLAPLVVRRRMPVPFDRVKLVASARVGGLKYLLKPASRWDPELLRIAGLLVHKGNIVWDVGANVGLFTLAAAALSGIGGRVLAIEADCEAATLLYRTMRISPSGSATMTLLPVAVGRETGFVEFSIANRARAANAIKGFGSTQTGGVREVRTLPCVACDDLLNSFPPPNVLKIDVEGAEGEVLAGAGKVVTSVRPVIYCEVSNDARAAVTEIFHDNAYQLWDGRYFGCNGVTGPPIEEAADNTVAIPTEKLLEFGIKQSAEHTYQGATQDIGAA